MCAFIQKIPRSAAFSGEGDGGGERTVQRRKTVIVITKIAALY